MLSKKWCYFESNRFCKSGHSCTEGMGCMTTFETFEITVVWIELSSTSSTSNSCLPQRSVWSQKDSSKALAAGPIFLRSMVVRWTMDNSTNVQKARRLQLPTGVNLVMNGKFESSSLNWFKGNQTLPSQKGMRIYVETAGVTNVPRIWPRSKGTSLKHFVPTPKNIRKYSGMPFSSIFPEMKTHLASWRIAMSSNCQPPTSL